MRVAGSFELTVEKHRGKWVVRQKGYDSATGRRKVAQLGTFPTRKAALAFADSASVSGGGSSLETVSGYVRDSWLRGVEARVDEGTFDQYRWAVERHIVPLIGEVKLRDVTPELLSEWIRELCLPGDSGEIRLGRTSAGLVRRVLSMALGSAVERELLPRNPVHATSMPRTRRTQKRKGWTFDEARAFRQAADGHDLFAAFQLGLVTGLRRGELLGLDWAQVDLDRGLIEVVQQYVITKGRPILKPVVKTEAGDRLIAIGPRTSELLESHKATQATETAALFGPGVTAEAVFTTELGDRINPNTFSRLTKRLCVEAGVPPLSAKALRHTANSVGRSVVGDDKVMQERLGHADISITLGTYTETVPEQHRRAAEQLDELFS